MGRLVPLLTIGVKTFEHDAVDLRVDLGVLRRRRGNDRIAHLFENRELRIPSKDLLRCQHFVENQTE